MGFDRFPHLRDRHSHIRGQSSTRLVELRDCTYGAMFAMPSNDVRSRLVQSRAERMFVLSHLSCHDSAECFYREDLAFGIESVVSHEGFTLAVSKDVSFAVA